MTVFSRRSDWPRAPNSFAQALERTRESGRRLIDLSASNPTAVGLESSWTRIAAALANPDGANHSPDPLGLRCAREAVVGHYAERGIQVAPEQVMITASTSEAYGFLFRLLADPGEAILVPRPSYPLLDFLADLEPLTLRPYRLGYDGSWFIDFENGAAAANGARAMLVVSPHNPTGHTVSVDERRRMGELAREHRLALIVDEVFADYAPEHRSFADCNEVLTFTLSGLSKVALMPQLKLGWMVVSGPKDLRDEALARLELIADSFLSVATPVQLGLRELLAIGSQARKSLQARIATNRAALRQCRPPGAVWDILAGEGGWHALLQVPRTRTQDAWCEALLDTGVVVQPGYLYDLESPQVLVISLIGPVKEFVRGAEIVARVLA